MERGGLQQKLQDKFPVFEVEDERPYSHQYREQRQAESMSRLQLILRRIKLLIDFFKPYVRLIRMMVTYIAPLIMMVLYLTHSKMRTKRMWKFIRNFKSDRTFFMGSPLQSQSHGIMELTQFNDMFWVRLTQVIATVIGY